MTHYEFHVFALKWLIRQFVDELKLGGEQVKPKTIPSLDSLLNFSDLSGFCGGILSHCV